MQTIINVAQMVKNILHALGGGYYSGDDWEDVNKIVIE